ncbi:MAG TPA: metallophosphoesterase family protein [Planctomycetota bacterium]|nr:metallophosphoesterase family protein [Planctomycetota bacterium]
MRRAIISDIHGNLVALEAALQDCDQQKVDEIVCLGDICGYGPDPIDCVDLIRKRCAWVLCGNHDAALFMSVPIGFNKYAKDAIEWQRSVLQPRWYSFPGKRSRWDWLQNLPASRTEGDVLYVHASPRDPLMEYVEEGDFADMGFGPSQKAIEIFEKIKHLSFCGHSHRPGVVTDQYLWRKPHELPEMSAFIEPMQKTLVNIGSVGQPRDNNPKGCYVIYDDKANTVTFRRVEYDIKAAQERFASVPQLDFRLAKRLETGN